MAFLASLSCVLCLFRQVQASNDASLLYHELFSLYVHIPRRCSSSSLCCTIFELFNVELEGHSAERIYFRQRSSDGCTQKGFTLNTRPNQFFYLCRMVFINLLFLSTMSITSWLDRCSGQLIFINLVQIHISNDSNLWMSTFVNVYVSAAYNTVLQIRVVTILLAYSDDNYRNEDQSHFQR